MKKIMSIILCVAVVVTMMAGVTTNCLAYEYGRDGLGPIVFTGGMRDFLWPVPSEHNLKSCFWDTRYHYAIDIAAPGGTEVVSSYDGEVVAVESSQTWATAGYGNYVVVKHEDYILGTGETVSLYTKYNHLSKTSVSVGTKVAAGDKVGEVGSTGYSEGNHLDYQVFYGDWGTKSNSIDPYANQLLELPSDITVTDSWYCGPQYMSLVKDIYSKALAYSRNPDGVTASRTQITALADGAKVRSGPAQTYDVVQTLSAGESLISTGFVVNTSGNKWLYLPSLNGYIYAERVRCVTADGGVEIPADVIPLEEPVRMTVNHDKAVLREGPGKSYAKIFNPQKGDGLTVLAFCINQDGNYWCYTDQGYIYAPRLTVAGSASITGASMPSSIAYGNIFVLKGTVSCDNPAELTAEVLDSNGNVSMSKTDDVNKNYSLQNSAVDKAMAFNALPVGEYILRYTVKETVEDPIKAMCVDVTTVVAEKTFTVT